MPVVLVALCLLSRKHRMIPYHIQRVFFNDAEK